MRDIEFRGKRTDDGEWMYGYICCYGWTGEEKTYIIVPYYGGALYSIEVDPSTVGQYTGLKDKNGTTRIITMVSLSSTVCGSYDKENPRTEITIKER